MEKSETVQKMEEASKKAFNEKFIRFGQNINNEKLGYVAIEGNIFGSNIREIEDVGFKIALIEATAKNSLIIHLREKMENEK